MKLYYQPRAHIDELFVGQCTVHRASGSSAARWWLLWFHVNLDSPGVSADAVPPGVLTPSRWHELIEIMGVPDSECWAMGEAA